MNSIIVLSIKNITDEKLYYVPLLLNAEEQNENKFKVEYSSCFKDVALTDLVNKMRAGFEFNMIMIQSFHGYAVYRQKQLLSQLHIGEAGKLLHIVQPITDPYSLQEGLIQIHLKEPIKLSEFGNIMLEYLMPDAELRIFFYVKEKE